MKAIIVEPSVVAPLLRRKGC